MGGEVAMVFFFHYWLWLTSFLIIVVIDLALVLLQLVLTALWCNQCPWSDCQVTLHIAFVHSFVNPLLLIILHRNTRNATCSLLTCGLPLDTSETGSQGELWGSKVGLGFNLSLSEEGGIMLTRVEAKNGSSGRHQTKLQGKQSSAQEF